MNYEDVKKPDTTFPDPGDEPAYTEDNEFEICRDGGILPDDIADPDKAKRYADWLRKNPTTA